MEPRSIANLVSLPRRREENEPSVCAQRSESGGLRAQLALAVHYTCCLWTCLFVRRLPYQGKVPKISKTDRWLMCWWAFTGLTHIILEGYFAFSPEFYKDKSGFYLAEVWKEYSKGDSRYAARDAGVVAVEGITAVLEGPASLLSVYAIATGKSYSYILQFAISLGQLYGTAVYFMTSYLEGDNFAASPYYYNLYYIGANASWVVIPSLIAIRCWKKICAAPQLQGQKKNKVR
ncbi:hypothetical protein CISIN_1g040128mg [Citrus sinensis]|uniref:EXPERA domain-containing protein n=2 Tax=Citrus TaxID=2706 RepID=A0A067E783_CITSI|nr:hypothetical protein CISIN_1g040128mg [Citrus sinensis]